VTGGNTVNPRIGSRAKQTCTVGEEQTVEVVRNHEDGTWEGLAVLLRREMRRRSSRATDSSTRNGGGAIFGQPQERQFDRQVGPHGLGTRRESRRQGQEGRARMLTHAAHPGRKDLEDPGGAPKGVASKVEEGSGEAERRGIDRGIPPVEGPRWVEQAARIRLPRASAAPSVCVWRATYAAPR